LCSAQGPLTVTGGPGKERNLFLLSVCNKINLTKLLNTLHVGSTSLYMCAEAGLNDEMRELVDKPRATIGLQY